MHRFYTWLRTHPTLVDGFWAVPLFLMGLLEISSGIKPWPDNIGYLLVTVVLCVALTVRRRYPLWTGLAGALTAVLQVAFDFGVRPADLVLLFLVFNVAARGRSRTLSRLALLFGALAGPIAVLRWHPHDIGSAIVFNCLITAGPFVMAWVLGDSSRTRQAYYAQLEDRAVRLERERDAQVKVATAGERARIARELHDVVAHNVSAMVVQADGAKYALDTEPRQSREALETISGTGRQALAEMRRLLGVLRSEDSSEVVPQPGVEQIGELLERVRGTGLPVELIVDGEVCSLARGVELTVYRITQEALTNTRKHGGPSTRAAVRMYYGERDLSVTIEDDGRGAMAASSEEGGDDGLGHGLIGMRERVGMVGGTFSAGPRPGGGFRIHISLPLAGTASTEAAGQD